MPSAPLDTCPPRKRRLAAVLVRTPLTRAARRHERRHPLLRVFNWHSVPPRFADRFERQLEQLAARYELTPPDRLEQLTAEGPGDRPRAIITLDDGLANHAEVAAPIIERWDATAILCVPAAFPDVPRDQQPEWFGTHVYPRPTELHGPDDVYAASWDQLRELAARGHRICSHGMFHTVLSGGTPADVIRREVEDSRALIEERLPGVTANGFCWPAAAAADAALASETIRRTYDYSLGNDVRPLRGGDEPYDLPRINLEVSWPDEVVNLQLSGVLDGLYRVRRGLR